MSYVRTEGSLPMLELAEATIDQLAVQNTWYTVAELYNVKVQDISFICTVIAETVEVRWTIDSKTNTRQVAGAVAGSIYTASWNGDAGGETIVFDTGQSYFKSRPYFAEGRHVKIEIRKTTTAGASHLQANVLYLKL